MVVDPLIDPDPRALREADFRQTIDSGFGDGWNHYAHSMAWFNGKLYVGTSRAPMAALRLSQPPPQMFPWPVQAPDDLYDIDRRAQIWQYTAETQSWKRVFRSPVVTGTNKRTDVPSYIGLRGMAVYQDAGDAAPCLYVTTWSPHTAHSPDLLRSEDGEHFAPVARPPFAPTVRAFRTLQPFQNRVHISPTASGSAKGFLQDISSEAVIYANADLRTPHWVPVSEEGFGNKANATVFEMGLFDGHLYGGTINSQSGCELWKTRGGDPPYTWTPVFKDGAGRGQLNEAIAAMCEFKGALYVSMGIINGGYHRGANIGPAAAEVIRVYPDDRWELIVGHARATPEGMRYPLSGFGPGFDSLFNGYVWRMCVHDGYLYAGTLNWTNSTPYMPINLWPEDALGLVRRWGDEALLAKLGGAELWRTADGIHWEPVTRNGFGNKYNWGIRTLVSTPHGLFVGTANPYGPKVAVKRNGQWQYVYNARGGCEIWQGARGQMDSP